MKETAIVETYTAHENDAVQNIDILLRFTCSEDVKYQITSFWALKDYLLLTKPDQIPDLKEMIKSFTIGCLSQEN